MNSKIINSIEIKIEMMSMIVCLYFFFPEEITHLPTPLFLLLEIMEFKTCKIQE